MSDIVNDRQAALDLLTATHEFPAPVVVKVIGVNQDEFLGRVLEVVRARLGLAVNPDHSTRETKAGRHLAVTMEPTFSRAEEVLAVYEGLRAVEGVVMVL